MDTDNPITMFYQWRKQEEPRTPPDLKGLAEYMQVPLKTLQDWERGVKQKEVEAEAAKYDSVKFLRLHQAQVDAALLKEALTGNVKAAELISKRTGVYSDDKDAKKIDAGEMANMLLEASKQLKEKGFTLKDESK